MDLKFWIIIGLVIAGILWNYQIIHSGNSPEFNFSGGYCNKNGMYQLIKPSGDLIKTISYVEACN